MIFMPWAFGRRPKAICTDFVVCTAREACAPVFKETTVTVNAPPGFAIWRYTYSELDPMDMATVSKPS